MLIWQVEFYPAKEEDDSPFDYIRNLSDKSDSAIIERRLETIEALQSTDWPPSWTKKIVDDIFELRANKHRLFFCFDGRKIIILHACRKVTQKTPKKDIERAKSNLENYNKKR